MTDKLVSGWVFNTITTLMSGFPLTPQDGSDRLRRRRYEESRPPSLNPKFSGPIFVGSPNEWFNPNAFVLPPAGTYGDLGRGTITGPGLVGYGCLPVQEHEITEKMALQFRAEFFNVLNHANFDTPNLTVFSGSAISPSAGQITATANFVPADSVRTEADLLSELCACHCSGVMLPSQLVMADSA